MPEQRRGKDRAFLYVRINFIQRDFLLGQRSSGALFTTVCFCVNADFRKIEVGRHIPAHFVRQKLEQILRM